MSLTVLEVSFEVANKVGGIHTVLKSKVSKMIEKTDDFYEVGPYFKDKANVEFEELETSPEMKKVFDFVESKYGIKCHFGKWLINGTPKTILVEPGSFKENLNQIKNELWNNYRIDSMNTDFWVNEPLLWSYATGILIEQLVEQKVLQADIVVHFHEWLCGAGLLYLKSRNVPVGLVFTTHATTLGRSLAESGYMLYDKINDGLAKNEIVEEKLAYDFGVHTKHQIEKASAIESDAFTTVSDVVNDEAQYILGKSADVVTPNGIDVNKFPNMEEISFLHNENKKQINNFVSAYFSPYYKMDFSKHNTLYFFTSGRFEMHNKGIDVFINSLSLLNRKLKAEKSKKTIVSFIFVPMETMGRKSEVLENLSLFDMIENETDRNMPSVKINLINSILSGENPAEKKILPLDFVEHARLLIRQIKAKRGRNPPLCTFEVHENNAILNLIKENGLLNREEDKVKVIFYPSYLSSVDGLLNMDYYSVVVGCHLGVFPSYYEPWGYTPMENAALGVPTITTDLSGYGKFIQRKISTKYSSINVINRRLTSSDATATELSETMHWFANLTLKERIAKKIDAKKNVSLTRWSNLIEYYMEAYKIAVEKTKSKSPAKNPKKATPGKKKK
ncbi:MAG: glycogen/starch synthase [Candidatus Diapherotrites archaeon]|nr:glycogen/starch synthase [Candidatus Diapherotrites archaeon]